MRKILYSSVALIASCGVAAAEVSVGGDASIGMKFTEGADDELTIAHNIDLNLTLSGQTDGGLSFGASLTFSNEQGVTGQESAISDDLAGATSPSPTAPVTLEIDNFVDLGGARLRKDAAGNDVAITSDSRTVYLDSGGETTDYALETTKAVTTDGSEVAAYYTRFSGDYNAAKTDNFTIADYASTIDDVTYYIIGTEGQKNYRVLYEDQGSWHAVTNTADTLSLANVLKAKASGSLDKVPVGISIQSTDEDLVALRDRNDKIAAGKTALAESPLTRPGVTFTDTDTDTNTNTHSVESGGKTDNEGTVYISGGFGKISVGDVSAADTAASGIADVGYNGLGVDDVAESLRGKSKRDVLYEFSAAGVSIGVSGSTGKGSDAGFALGVKYSLDPISFGIGYADEDGLATVSLGVGATLGDISTNLMYSTKGRGTGVKGNDNAIGVDASFKATDNMTVTFAGANSEIAGKDSRAYGIGLTFDLGGGAEVGMGFASIDKSSVADLGLNLTF